VRGLFAGEIGSMLEGPKIGQQAPWLLTSDDYAQLEKDLGKKEAMGTFFWLCRGLYMTRVSDGLRRKRTTEKENDGEIERHSSLRESHKPLALPFQYALYRRISQQ